LTDNPLPVSRAAVSVRLSKLSSRICA